MLNAKALIIGLSLLSFWAPFKKIPPLFKRVVSIIVPASLSTEPGVVTVEFDPNDEPNIGGYILHYGVAPGAYTQHKNIGKTAIGSINGLVPGVPYYMAVSAYDTTGQISEFSNEITYTVATTEINWIAAPDPPITNYTFTKSKDPTDRLDYFYTHFQFQALPSVKYVVQYKNDLSASTWNVLEQFNSRKAETLYCSYRFTPPPLAVFFRVKVAF